MTKISKVYCYIVVNIHAAVSPPEVYGLVVGTGAGSLFVGVLVGAACSCIIMRKLSDSSSHQDVKIGALQDIGTTTGNMTSSDAYGMAEMPAEQHNYDYISAISDNK